MDDVGQEHGPRLAVHVDGEGDRTVVVVPGILATRIIFGGLIESLVKRGFRVVSFDPRGLGENRDKVGGKRSIEFSDRVEDLCQVLSDHVRRGDDVTLIGHSLGGSVVFGAVVKANRDRLPWIEQVNRLVIVGTPCRFSRSKHRYWRHFPTPRTIKLLRRFASKNGWLGFPEFILAQVLVAWPLATWASLWPVRWLILPVVKYTLERAYLVHNLVERGVPTVLLNVGDANAQEIKQMLDLGVLDRDSVPLLSELLTWKMDPDGAVRLNGRDVALEASRLGIPILAIASKADHFVPEEEALAVEGEHALVEPACGHGAYFLSRFSDDVETRILDFIEKTVSVR